MCKNSIIGIRQIEMYKKWAIHLGKNMANTIFHVKCVYFFDVVIVFLRNEKPRSDKFTMLASHWIVECLLNKLGEMIISVKFGKLNQHKEM